MARVVEARAGRVSFVAVRERGTTLFIVPVPSGKGRAALLFAAKTRSRRSRWWSPTLAVAGRPLEEMVSKLKVLAEGGGGIYRFASRRTGMFVKVAVRAGRVEVALGQGKRVFASLQLKPGDLKRLAYGLERALAKPSDLPLPLTWRDKERIFGSYI